MLLGSGRFIPTREGSSRLITSSIDSLKVGSRRAFYIESNTRRLDKLDTEINTRVRKITQHTAFELQAEVQAIIRQKNIIDTGFLLNSVQGYVSENGLSVYLDIGAYYAVYIEFGTVHMSARPFVGPAVANVGPRYVRAVRQAVREGCMAP